MSLFVSRGNKEFVRQNYSEALSFYSLASKSSDSKNVLDESFKNELITGYQIGLPYISKESYMEHLKGSFKNESMLSIQKAIDRISFNDSMNDLLSQSSDDPEFFDEIVEKSFLNDLNRINDQIDENKNDMNVLSHRCYIYSQIGDYQNALDDTKMLIDANQNSALNWQIRAEAAWFMNDADTLAELINYLQGVGLCLNIYYAKYYWLMKEYDKADDYINKAVALEESGSIITRIRFNMSRGRINKVIQDDPYAPIIIFTKQRFPSDLSQKILSRFPFLNYLIIYYHQTFLRQFNSIPLSMHIPFNIQNAWVQGFQIPIKEIPKSLIINGFPKDYIFRIKD